MKSGNSIEVRNICKKFKVYYDKGSSLKEKVLFKNRNRYEEREVLKGISFEVKKGEAIGLIGSNGCGKSTTLKLLTRIIYPDSGSIDISGRVSSLIELGAGFHPDMSGRENIYTNASIFGLTRKEIDRRMEDIVAFSELEEFLDNPVRTYSSGMYMRLAFSVAINVDAEVLLIDEILAVGDTNFQAKCFNKLREIKVQGTTIVIVSHSLGQIEQICDRTLWIQEGEIKAEGLPREVHPEYLDYMGGKRQDIIEKEQVRQNNKTNSNEGKNDSIKNPSDINTTEAVVNKSVDRWGNGFARITDIRSLDNTGAEKRIFKTGEIMVLEVNYNLISMVEDAVLGIGVFRSDGLQCYGTNTRIDQFSKFNLIKDGKFKIEIQIQYLPGEYYIDVAIESGLGLPIDYYTKAYKFETYSDISDIGISRIKHKWVIE